MRDNPQKVKGAICGEDFLSEQKCSLEGALGPAQHVGHPPPTQNDLKGVLFRQKSFYPHKMTFDGEHGGKLSAAEQQKADLEKF